MPRPASGDPYITCLWASNYRSLTENVEVRFGPLTALVGPNGAGKSNVLDALRFVRDALTDGLETAVSRRLGFARLRHTPTSGRPRTMSVHVEVVTDDVRSIYGFTVAAAQGGTFRVSHEYLSRAEGDAEDRAILLERGDGLRTAPAGLTPVVSPRELVLPSVAAHPAFMPVYHALRQVRVHAISPRLLATPQPVGKAPPLDDEGTNWAEVLLAMKADRHAQLIGALTAVLPDLVDIDVAAVNGFRSVEFVHQSSNGRRRSFNAAQESDGTLRIAGILTALLQDDTPSFLGIEEPELTINPGLLRLLVDRLRDASARTTVAVSSHSPDLLDLVTGPEIRVVEQVEGESFVSALEEGQLDVLRRRLMSPGEILRSGGLRGRAPRRDLDEDISDVVVIGAPG